MEFCKIHHSLKPNYMNSTPTTFTSSVDEMYYKTKQAISYQPKFFKTRKVGNVFKQYDYRYLKFRKTFFFMIAFSFVLNFYSKGQPTIQCLRDPNSTLPFLDLGNIFGQGRNSSSFLYDLQNLNSVP